MIIAWEFKDYSYNEKYNFIVNILTHVQENSFFEDLRDLFRAVKKPSEEMLIIVFEIIESIIKYIQEKVSNLKQEWLKAIQSKMNQIKITELNENEKLEDELEDLLTALD